jgi:hypothetical protein
MQVLKIADWAQADSVFRSFNLWDRLMQSPITFSSPSPSGRDQGVMTLPGGKRLEGKFVKGEYAGQ